MTHHWRQPLQSLRRQAFAVRAGTRPVCRDGLHGADPAIQRVVAGFFARVEAFFYQCVADGQRCGTITLAQPAEDLARLLLGILVGVRVMARAQPDRTLLEGMVKPALALLDG